MSTDYKILADLSTNLLGAIDPSGKITFLNKAFAQAMGIEPKQIEGSPWQALVPEEKQEWLSGQLNKIKSSSKKQKSFQYKLAAGSHKDQLMSWQWAYQEKTQTWYIQGEPLETAPLSEGKRTNFEENLQALNRAMESREAKLIAGDPEIRQLAEGLLKHVDQYKLISQNVSDIVCLHEPINAIYLYASPSTYKLTGFTPDQLIGTTPYEYFHPDDVHLLQPDHEKSKQGDSESIKLTYRFRKKDGTYRWMESESKPIKDTKGNVLLILSATRDVHERIQAERSRNAYFEYYKILANKIPNGAVFLIDKNSNYLIAEGEELKRINKTSSDYIGQNSREIFDDRGLRLVQPYFDRVLKGERVKFEYHNFNQQYLVLGEPYRNAKQEIDCGIILLQNITESKMGELRLQQTLNELNFQKSALDLSAQVSITDPTGVIIYVNNRFCEASKYTKEELLGETHAIFNSHYHAETFFEEMWRTILKGEVWNDEIKNIDKHGNPFWVDTTIVPFVDADNYVTKFVSIRFDITRRKIIEEELKAKNYELDNFVYHTSHDLRAPLTTIMGLVNVIQSEENPQAIKQYTQMIEDTVFKLDEFIKSILRYSQSNNSQAVVKPIDFEELINQIRKEMRYMENYARLKFELNLNTKETFFSDPVRLSIIFKNIIGNAIKYLNPRESRSYLTITIDSQPTQARIIFADNGQGIPAAYQDKIFNMFYRANEGSDGSGLGLYIVKQTVQKLNGTIHLESQERIGTTVTLHLPNKITVASQVEQSV